MSGIRYMRYRGNAIYLIYADNLSGDDEDPFQKYIPTHAANPTQSYILQSPYCLNGSCLYASNLRSCILSEKFILNA